MLEALLVFFVIIRCGLKWFAVLAQEVEHRRGKEEVPSSNLGNGLVIENKALDSQKVNDTLRDGQNDCHFL